MELRCPNKYCSTVNPITGQRPQKLLIGSITGRDYEIAIKCPRCKTLVTVTPIGIKETRPTSTV